jgi:alanine-alpha-ketoisovalerate/valine-pyruvate aminotransferase
MEIESDELIKSKILRALAKKNKWLHAHTSLTNVIKWVYVKHDGKRTKKLINELKKKGLILVKPTHYGEEVSLNFYQKDKIFEIIKKHYPEEI